MVSLEKPEHSSILALNSLLAEALFLVFTDQGSHLTTRTLHSKWFEPRSISS